MSASAKTMFGDLPPSSSVEPMKRDAVEAAMRAPVAVLPVKEILARRRSSTSAAPASAPKPVTTLMTPGGKPASSASVGQPQDGGRGVFGRFDDDGVAGGEGGGELAGGQRQRRVPRGDGADDAEGFAEGVVQHGAAGARDGVALDLVRQPGVVVVVLGHRGELARAFHAGACRCPGIPCGPVRRRARRPGRPDGGADARVWSGSGPARRGSRRLPRRLRRRGRRRRRCRARPGTARPVWPGWCSRSTPRTTVEPTRR